MLIACNILLYKESILINRHKLCAICHVLLINLFSFSSLPGTVLYNISKETNIQLYDKSVLVHNLIYISSYHMTYYLVTTMFYLTSKQTSFSHVFSHFPLICMQICDN